MPSNVIPLSPRPQRTTGTPPAARPGVSTSDTEQAPEPAVYTVAEVADLLSLSLGSAYALVRTGDIPAKKLGGRWVVPRRRFHDWLDNLPDATPGDIERELHSLARRA